MTAQMGGDTVLAGAIPGAVNEIFSGALQRYEEKYGPISPDQRQWLALVGGVITNYATGHTLQTGGAVGVYGTKWNTFKEKSDWKSLGEACNHMYDETDKEFADTEINMMQWKLDNPSIDDSREESVTRLSRYSSAMLGGTIPRFESAVVLYQHAIDGGGEKRWFKKDSVIAKDLINSEIFQTRIKKEGEKILKGSSKVITFSEEMKGSFAQKVAFGKVKFAVEIRKDKNSHIFVTGQARDNYDFSYLPDASEVYSKKEFIRELNNTAYWLQCTGKIKPYIWGAELSWDFMPGEQ